MIFRLQIDHSKDLLDKFKPDSALEFLEKLRKQVWNRGSVTNIDKFRILSNIGSAKYMMGSFEEAASFFIEAFAYNKEDEKALLNIAVAYSILGQHEKSIEYAKKLININPQNTNALYILIQCEDKNFKDQEAELPVTLREKTEILAALGFKALTQISYLESNQYFEKAIAIDTEDNPDYKATLASVKLEMITNQYLNIGGLNKIVTSSESIALLNSAIDKLKNTELIKYKYQWFVNRSVAKKILGDIKGAEEDIMQALTYRPDDIVSKQNLALLKFENNEPEKGIRLLEEIKNNKEIPEVKVLLADMYRINKKYEEAERTIQEVLKSNNDVKLITNAKEY